jgi:RNA polymerase sigma-70 factor (ECF subfamily)
MPHYEAMGSSWAARTEQGPGASLPGGPDPASLLGLSGHGDSVAFAQLYDTTSSRVFALVLMITRDVTTAEEVTEAVYAHVWQHSGRFDPGAGSALAWILTVARRLAAHDHQASA